MNFQTIFESLNNDSRTMDNPALDWVAAAQQHGMDRNQAREYNTYSSERIYSNASHNEAMATIERDRKRHQRG